MAEVRVREATAEDADVLAPMIQRAFDGPASGYTITGQHGYPKFLRRELETPASDDRLRLVAVTGDGPVGYAEFQLQAGERVLLSRICVAASARGQGVGGRLLDGASTRFEQDALWELDVFASNRPALAWYERLGLVVEKSRRWVAGSLPLSGPPAAVVDLARVRAQYVDWGFSPFRLESGASLALVGHALRVADVEQLADVELLAALRGTFPELRKVLFIGEGELLPDADSLGLEWIDTSLRLSGRFRFGV